MLEETPHSTSTTYPHFKCLLGLPWFGKEQLKEAGQCSGCSSPLPHMTETTKVSPGHRLTSTVHTWSHYYFHNFLTFPLERAQETKHVNRSHLTQSRWKLLENLQWQKRSTIQILPKVQTHPTAGWLFTVCLLCNFIIWDS